MTPFYLLGLLLLGIAFLVAQTRFYDAHRSVYRLWRPRAEIGPTTLFYTLPEHRAMLRATFHRDPDEAVERARRRYLTVLAVTVVYALLAIPVALVFGA